VRVEVQDAEGTPLPGLRLEDCGELAGDDVRREVRWGHGEALAAQEGKPVRLRFVMRDADLFSLQFGR
jgi:hypothetical protein